MSQVQGTPRNFSYTLQTTADKTTFWHIWTDVKNWHTWDTPLREAKLEGAFEEGSKGSVVTAQGQRSSFIITEVNPLQSYIFVTQLPGARLVVRRYISKEATTSFAFTHHITFEGPLAFLFSGLLGKGFMKALQPVMEKLKRIAESEAG